MADFNARSVEFKGSLVVLGPIETVFDLFSPLGERPWVPDWAYAFIGLTPEGARHAIVITRSTPS
jgi:hypothetical protein